jgi:hypothetical protein
VRLTGDRSGHTLNEQKITLRTEFLITTRRPANQAPNAQEVYFALRAAAGLVWSYDTGCEETSMLPCLKRAFDLGYGPAFWYALRFCEQTGTPKPPWLRDALNSYIEDRIKGVPVKNNVGRPKEWFRDLAIFVNVNLWRMEARSLGRKIRWISEDFALRIIREKLYGRNFVGDHANDHISTLSRAYHKAKRRFSTTD